MDDTAAREAMKAWHATTQKATEATKASGIDWTKTKVDPKDVGFSMGPMLTEEQFRAYCQESGTTPHIIKK